MADVAPSASPIAHWVTRLARAELPVLAESTQALAAMVNAIDTIGTRELSAAVLNDPLLTLRVLQAANQQPSRHAAHDITTVTHAVMKFGVGPFLRRFGTLPTIETRLASHPAVATHLAEIIQRARHAATQARDFAAVRHDRDPEEAAIAALLIDFPEMLLCVHAPEVAATLLHEERTHAPRAVELQTLGVALADLQQPLAAALGVPEMLRALTDPGNVERPRVFGIHLASRIAHHLEHGAPPEALDDDLRQAATWLRLPLEEITQTVHVNAQRVACPDALEPQPAAAALHLDKVDEAMRDIGAHLDGSLNLHEMMMLALTGLHEGAALRRVVFALLAADRKQLRARLWVGVDPGAALAGFTLALNPPNLFTRLLERQQAVWVRTPHPAPLAPLLTPALRALVTPGPFFAMSLFVHDKPVGLVYADQGGANDLDEPRYALFKRLCSRAAEGLAHLASGPRAQPR